MKVLLVTLNAKFIHSSLALAYLKAYCQSDLWQIETREYTINEPLDDILADIHMTKPDILCFSCYIWNIEHTLEICENFKKVNPNIPIILGGPEVSYDAEEVLMNNPIDFVIRGEGELTLYELLNNLANDTDYTDIRGLTYGIGDLVKENQDRILIKDLDIIPFPYKDNLSIYKNKTIYYESSRGCPFNCAYCLSSVTRGVRFFSLDRVKEDLSYLMLNKVKEVKFVDRTFNCNEKRAMAIMQHIINNNIETKFHFEIGAELISAEFMDFLQKVPPGIFDFEIGIQSTFSSALEAVNRQANWHILADNIKQLIALGNIHIHLDLIAGLPYEDYNRFAKSFNDVYNFQADKIQLGFLKLLKGSAIEDDAREYDYIYQAKAPYQVLANHVITYDELIKLEQIAKLVNRYYNTHIIEETLAYTIREIFYGNAFALFASLADYWQENGLFYVGHRRDREYSLMKAFIETNFPSHTEKINETLKYDYFKHNKSYHLPEQLSTEESINVDEILNNILRNELFIAEYIPYLKGKTVRDMKKQIHLVYFTYNPMAGYSKPGYLLFEYKGRQQQKAFRITDITSFIM